MSKSIAVTALAYFTIIFLLAGTKAVAADHCSDQFYIEKKLANGAKWDMCWSHSKNLGIGYHHIYYTPKNNPRRMVLFEASIAQIHVPYDDNGARFHDVSDFGLGDDGADNNNLLSLSAAECPSGVLSNFNSKGAVCHRVVKNGDA